MINAKKHLIDRYNTDERITSMMALYNDDQRHPLLSGFDALILVVTNDEHAVGSITHYIEDGLHVQERWLSGHDLKQWLFEDGRRHVIQWIFEGDILIDRHGYMQSLKDSLLAFDQDLREQKLLKEFAMFLNTYLRSKEYLRQDYLLDAYSQILAALHHWARITVIEAGTHPEVIVWQQVYKINPGVYKLYDELTHSEETLEQRVQLLVLACDFAIVSKMKECCKLLLRIMKNRDSAWSIGELAQHPMISALGIDLSPVLKKLVSKTLVREIMVAQDATLDRIELQYCAV